ncbi:MAG: RICIN domain-containing protein [Bacteroidales bacterium]|nr:RICIN domain-containing protein [Bacteroidales bacterium]
MKRITFLLTLLLLCFAGGVKAQTEITDLSQLSNSKVYTVSLYDSGRGTWTYNPSDPTRLYSTSKMGSTVNVFNPNQQFVFLTPDDGTTYYLYSVGAEKFVNYTSDGRASIDTYPVSKVTFASSTGSYTTHPFVVALDGHHVGISNSYSYGVITFWNSTADGGNCIKIIEQSDFSETAKTEALARISLGNGVQRNSLLSTISTAEDLILEKKFCPSLSEEISALKVMVSEAKSLVESSSATAEELSATAEELTAKVTAINNAIVQTYSSISEISSTQAYYLRNVASGRYLTVVTNGAAEGVKIKNKTSALKDAQLFYVKAVDGVENGFAIQNVNSGKYLAASSNWDFKTQDASFTFIANDADGLNALMFARNDNTAQFFGPNNGTTSEGAAIYSNHPVSDGIYSQWYLELYDEEEAAAIQAVQEKLAAAQAHAMNDAYSLFQSKGLQQDGSNYSSNYASTQEGSLAALVDGVTTTYFHTQYGSATSDDFHHLQIQADMSAQTAVRFISRKRSQNNANRPTTILVQGSANGTDFEDIQTLKNLPSTSDDTTDPYYYSPALDVNGKNYQYIRFVVKATNNGAADASSHPFFTYSEFYLVPDCSEAAAFADILNATYLDDDLDAKVSAVNTAHNGMLSLINYNDLKTLVVTLEGYTTAIGTGLGQYVDNTGNFLTAYSEASTLTSADFNASTDYATPLEALNTAFEGLSINLPATGKYYRMRVVSQSSSANNYLSAYGNGKYLNTKVTESDAPTVFYLTSDNKLQAVYNDTYIKTASNNFGNLEMTSNADEAMTWTITGSTSVTGTYRLKAGENEMYLYDWTSYSRANTLIANDPNTPRCQWTIEEVVLDEELIKTFDLSLISALQSVEPIALTEGAEVIYPSEYTYTPAELNVSIANIKAFSSDVYSEVKTMITSTDYANVSHYKGLCESYGVALSVPCTLKYRFSTLILPINYAFPSTWSVYSCSAADENDVLTLSTVTSGGSPKNTPFIVEYTDEATMPTAEAPKTYQFIGYSNGAATEDQTNGWLTGVLTEGGATVPTNSYALAVNKTTGKQGFYVTNGTVTCPQYKCYLTVSAESAAPKALFFPGGEGQQTGIENVFGGDENGTVTIYNLAGQRLNKLEKGINIVNGRKVLVK